MRRPLPPAYWQQRAHPSGNLLAPDKVKAVRACRQHLSALAKPVDPEAVLRGACQRVARSRPSVLARVAAFLVARVYAARSGSPSLTIPRDDGQRLREVISEVSLSLLFSMVFVSDFFRFDSNDVVASPAENLHSFDGFCLICLVKELKLFAVQSCSVLMPYV